MQQQKENKNIKPAVYGGTESGQFDQNKGSSHCPTDSRLSDQHHDKPLIEIDEYQTESDGLLNQVISPIQIQRSKVKNHQKVVP